jgi:hypothetical protein
MQEIIFHPRLALVPRLARPIALFMGVILFVLYLALLSLREAPVALAGSFAFLVVGFVLSFQIRRIVFTSSGFSVHYYNLSTSIYRSEEIQSIDDSTIRTTRGGFALFGLKNQEEYHEVLRTLKHSGWASTD